jgi:hypothetical protein
LRRAPFAKLKLEGAAVARTVRPRSRLPLAIVIVVGLIAVILAALMVFAPDPKTVEEAPAIAVPEAAAPAPMPKPVQPATAPTP